MEDTEGFLPLPPETMYFGFRSRAALLPLAKRI
jgi:hypothetical protein